MAKIDVLAEILKLNFRKATGLLFPFLGIFLIGGCTDIIHSVLISNNSTEKAHHGSEVTYIYRSRPARTNLHNPRHRHVAVDLGDGKIGFFNGFGVSTAEIFDLRTETFRILPWRQWFGDLSGIEIGRGRALLVDGRHDALFDMETEQLIKIQPTFTSKFQAIDGTTSGKGVRWPGMVLLASGEVFVCGGADDIFRPSDHCALFDPNTRQFRTVGKLAVPRMKHSTTLIDKDTVLIAGGIGVDHQHNFSSLEIFHLRKGQSELLSVSLPRPRHNHCAVLLADGKVLIVGGCCLSPELEGPLADAYLFDPRIGTLVSVGPMTVPRYRPQAARLPSGRVAVFGGNADERTIEIYDPELRAFLSTTYLMIEPRDSGFTVTPLKTGELLVVGGRINGGKRVLDTAEIFSECRQPVEK